MNDLLQTANSNQKMSSREIAELTGKQHKHVIRDIEILNDSYENLGLPKVGLTSYTDNWNRQQKEYLLTRMQCFDLMTGYSIELRIKVNRRWEKLERKDLQPLSHEQMVQKVLQENNKRIKALEANVEADKPKVTFADAVSSDSSCIDVETFAKYLNDHKHTTMGRNSLMKWFRKNSYLTLNNLPYQSVLNKGLMDVKEATYPHPKTNKPVPYGKVLITGKGQIYFANKFVNVLMPTIF